MGKPKLKPLKQWYCDTCGQIIEKPEDGWIEWLSDSDGVAREFRICHHAPESPLRKEAGSRDANCYRHVGHRDCQDMHLEEFLGVRGIVEMLSWVDIGPVHDPRKTSKTCRVKDVREWADIFRRLHVPYFEEARRYIPQGLASGYLGDENEIGAYLDDTLTGLIDEFGP